MKTTYIFLIASLCLSLAFSANLKRQQKSVIKGGDFCNEQVIELNIPAERLLDNFRNMSLPISIEDFFEEMNGNKSKVEQLPGSNASSIRDGNEEEPTGIMNGNRTSVEIEEEIPEEGGEEQPKYNGNATGVIGDGAKKEEEEPITTANITAPISTKNATGAEGGEEESEEKESPAAPKEEEEPITTANITAPISAKNATGDEGGEEESTAAAPKKEEEEEIIYEEVVDEEPVISMGGMMEGTSNETASNGNATAPTSPSEKNITEGEMERELVGGSSNATGTENKTTDESAEQPTDNSNKTTAEEKVPGEEEVGASNVTESGASNETEIEGTSNKTKKSFITKTGVVIGAKLPLQYVPTEGWWEGWNTIPKSFWVGDDFKAGNQFITLTNTINLSVSASPEGKIRISIQRDDISTLFLVEFIGQNVVNLRSYFGGYLSIGEDGNVNARSRTANADTQFTVLKTNRKCELDDANYLFLRSNSGRFLTIRGINVTGEQAVSNQALFKGVFWDESKSKCKAGEPKATEPEEAAVENTIEGQEATEKPIKTASNATKINSQKAVTGSRRHGNKTSETPSKLGARRSRNGEEEKEEENGAINNKLSMSRNSSGNNGGRDTEMPLSGEGRTKRKRIDSIEEEEASFLEQSNKIINTGDNSKDRNRLQNTRKTQKRPNVKNHERNNKLICPYGRNKKLLVLNIV